MLALCASLLYKCESVHSLSHIWFFATPWTVAARVLCPWNFPGKHTGMDCHSLLQRIFLTQGSNLGLPHCRWILYYLSHQGSPHYFTNITWLKYYLQSPWKMKQAWEVNHLLSTAGRAGTQTQISLTSVQNHVQHVSGSRTYWISWRVNWKFRFLGLDWKLIHSVINRAQESDFSMSGDLEAGGFQTILGNVAHGYTETT